MLFKSVNYSKRNVLILLLAMLALSAATATAADKVALGVINSERIVQEYGAARDAQEQFQTFMMELQQEIADREKDLQLMIEEIESQKMLLGQEALRTKLAELESAKSEYFEFQQSADSRAETEYQAKLQPIIDQVKLIAERIGKEEGYGLIIDIASVTTLYIDADVDLTDKVLESLIRGTEE
jgi:outer membrane protein